MIDYKEFEEIVVDILERDISSNEDQNLAISSPMDQSLFIVAGPGSGKTTVMVLKILKFIFVDDVSPNEIMATTFTKKAASELLSRILSWGDKIKKSIAPVIMNKIANGEIPSKTVYEDEKIQVIMNINPNSNGHLLVIPKSHIVNINDMNGELIQHCLQIIKEKLYPLLKEKLNCEGLTMVQNNELGQEIKHYHIHLIPRYQNDNIDLTYNKQLLNSLDDVFEKLS